MPQPRNNQSKARKRNDIVARRRRLVLLLRSGLTQAETAAQLGVSEGTVSEDLRLLREAAQAETAQDMAALLEAECRQLDLDEAMLRAELLDKDGRVRLGVYDRVVTTRDQRARWRGIEQAPKGGPGSLADLTGAWEALGLL